MVLSLCQMINGKTLKDARFLFVILTMAFWTHTVRAQEAYAVLSVDKKNLTFYYDNNKAIHEGTVIPSDDFRTLERYKSGWGSYYNDITTIVFDSSFAGYNELTDTSVWFAGLNNLISIVDLKYLNTQNVTNMRGMFLYCPLLTSVDLSQLNMSQVTTMWKSTA